MNPHGTAHYGVGFGIVFQFHAGNSRSNLDSQCVEVCLRPDCRRRGDLEETSSSSRTERIVQRDANGWREANVILRSGNAPKKLASEGSRRPRESPADRSLCIFPSAPFPKVNLGPLPGEGRWKNPPSLNNSQSLWGVNYHLNQVYFWKPQAQAASAGAVTSETKRKSPEVNASFVQ